MSDLISRSKLIMSLSDYALQESPNDNESTGEQRISKMIYDAIQNCISCVEEQPTAYDVDKVVEELEKELEKGNIAIDFGEFRLFEIVNQSDDVCEWKMDNVGASIGCRSDLHHTGYVNRTYCPYCGKKIKVVE